MKKRILTVLVLVAVSVFALVGCTIPQQKRIRNVFFDAQNGEAPIVVAMDENFEEPTPENGDLIFEGWYTSAELDERWEKPELLIRNTIVYAKWLTLNDVLAQYAQKNDWNFSVSYTETADGEVRAEGTYNYSNGLIQYVYEDDGVEYVDYLVTNEDGSLTYLADSLEYYYYAYEEGSFEYAYYSYPLKLLALQNLVAEDYTKVGEVFSAKNPAEAGAKLLSAKNWTMCDVYATSTEVTKVELGYAEKDVPVVLSFELSAYGEVEELSFPHVTHDFGDNYLMYVECSDPQCQYIGRNASTNSAKEYFYVSLDEAKKAEIDGVYNAMLENLAEAKNEPELEELFEQYDEFVSYIIEQYQIAKVLYSCDQTNGKATFDLMSKYYNEAITNYYAIFGLVYEVEAYRDLFYEGWTEAEIAEALEYSSSYGDVEYQEIKDSIDELLLDYDEVLYYYTYYKKLVNSVSSMQDVQDVIDIFGSYDEYLEAYETYEYCAYLINAYYNELVVLNNQLANKLGYENYMEYAYESRFGRAYTPAEVSVMRAYTKYYLPSVTYKLYMDYASAAQAVNTQGWASIADQLLYFTTVDTRFNIFNDIYDPELNPAFKDYTLKATDYVGRYLKDLSAGGTVDFFSSANKLFKDGNYYLGEEEGAYTYYISKHGQSILYFGPSYMDNMTFIHEFGHYYNYVYNRGVSLSMDHKETHSQGNEALYLAWLYNNCDEGTTLNGYNLAASYQLLNTSLTVLLATAVDEFEQAAYTGYYNGEALATDEDGLVDYAALFSEIFDTYGVLSLIASEDYWLNVVFDQAGYYISYAMSALPCLELYVMGVENFDAAKEAYFKLFTFTDCEDFWYTDESGYRVCNTNYIDVLEYCGFDSMFEGDLYELIYDYFYPAE